MLGNPNPGTRPLPTAAEDPYRRDMARQLKAAHDAEARKWTRKWAMDGARGSGSAHGRYSYTRWFFPPYGDRRGSCPRSRIRCTGRGRQLTATFLYATPGAEGIRQALKPPAPPRSPGISGTWFSCFSPELSQAAPPLLSNRTSRTRELGEPLVHDALRFGVGFSERCGRGWRPTPTTRLLHSSSSRLALSFASFRISFLISGIEFVWDWALRGVTSPAGTRKR
eukprot:Polyplicarium_translucidae@DN2085_c0_g1_i4.p1